MVQPEAGQTCIYPLCLQGILVHLVTYITIQATWASYRKV